MLKLVRIESVIWINCGKNATKNKMSFGLPIAMPKPSKKLETKVLLVLVLLHCGSDSFWG